MGNRTLARASAPQGVVVWGLIILPYAQVVVCVDGSRDDKAPYVYSGPRGASAIEQSTDLTEKASTPGGYGPLGGVVAVDRPSSTHERNKVDAKPL